MNEIQNYENLVSGKGRISDRFAQEKWTMGETVPGKLGRQLTDEKP